jgi:hypothetical protein
VDDLHRRIGNAEQKRHNEHAKTRLHQKRLVAAAFAVHFVRLDIVCQIGASKGYLRAC